MGNSIPSSTTRLSPLAATVSTEPDFVLESREQWASREPYHWANTIQRYDVTPDGQRILAIRDLTDAPRRHIVIQNFFEELNARVPN